MKKMWHILNRWNNYLKFFKEQDKDIYFTEEYVMLYENEKDRAECFLYQEEDNFFIIPYLKRKIEILDEVYYDFETPYGYGGPIVNKRDKKFIDRAFNIFYDISKKNKIIAGFIRFHPLLENYQFVNDKCLVCNNRKTIAIDLCLAQEDIWNKHIHSTHRNRIRKAKQTGLSFIVDEKLLYLNKFISVYNETMNKVKAEDFYYFEKDYYKKIKEQLNKHTFLSIISYKNKFISFAMFFSYGPFGHYHLGGSLSDYTCYGSNNFLFYHTALYMKEKGIKLFHLGGGSDESPENSLYRFKRKFSKNEYDFFVGKIIFDNDIYQKICKLWMKKNPEKKDFYGKIFLKYRY